MKPIVVVGSGASAVHFALTALEKGREVLMLDVGRSRPAPVMPDATWAQLKDQLPNPEGYFLGERFESVLLPGGRGEYYGFPPSKSHVFEGVPQFRHASSGFEPLVSFAKGGLAEAWTGGVYPFNQAELADFPFSASELAPYYDRVADRIGISGEEDDLARFMPVHQHLLPPLELDEHSRMLVEAYQRRRSQINRTLRCYLGRSRIATITRDRPGRKACSRLGRCLWGCPSGSLYVPSMTLDDCRRHPGFRYMGGVFVRRFLTRGSRVVAVTVEQAASGATEEIGVETLVLAAGTLATARIVLDSVRHAAGDDIMLDGLMDNRQILLPFLNLGMLRRRYDPDTYQYHQLGLGIEGADAKQYVHCQITTLKTAMIHPIVQKLPLDLRTALRLFRNVHAALGVVNINLHDTRRAENGVRLETGRGVAPSSLLVGYRPPAGEEARMKAVIKHVKRVLRALNCYVPPGMMHVRPMGASVHYAGLLPMSAARGRWTTSPHGQSHDFDNLFVADGTTFPFLPAKNLTFTLMANATRIADAVC
jgi:choline dehydrogenase-like flavoprotein